MVQRVRIQYAKRGPLRFTSHRDVARAFERAVRRAGVPVAFSQGFNPHPRISYASAAPTGAASEAEYLEVGFGDVVDPEQVRAALDAALPPGLDVVRAVQAAPGTGLAERIDASRWRVELPSVTPNRLTDAVTAFAAAGSVLVDRPTVQGRRRLEARAPVFLIRPGCSVEAGQPDETPDAADVARYAILDLVVRQVTPSVRPDDVLAGLRVVGNLEPPVPPRVTRLAQGRLTATGELVDPLTVDGGMGGVVGDRADIGEPSG